MESLTSDDNFEIYRRQLRLLFASAQQADVNTKLEASIEHGLTGQKFDFKRPRVLITSKMIQYQTTTLTSTWWRLSQSSAVYSSACGALSGVRQIR